MKKFETPEVEIEVFTIEDVITTSLIPPTENEDMGEWA